jgi:hypothetical protein
MTGVAIQNAGPDQAIQHWCTVCGSPFIYRFDEFYNSEQLRPIDRVCRTCFPRWVRRRERAIH